MATLVERFAAVVKGSIVLGLDVLAIVTEFIRQLAIVVDDAVDKLKDALTVKGE